MKSVSAVSGLKMLLFCVVRSISSIWFRFRLRSVSSAMTIYGVLLCFVCWVFFEEGFEALRWPFAVLGRLCFCLSLYLPLSGMVLDLAYELFLSVAALRLRPRMLAPLFCSIKAGFVLKWAEDSRTAIFWLFGVDCASAKNVTSGGSGVCYTNYLCFCSRWLSIGYWCICGLSCFLDWLWRPLWPLTPFD